MSGASFFAKVDGALRAAFVNGRGAAAEHFRRLRRRWDQRRSERAVHLLLAATLLAGCHGVGPDYHGPPKPDSPDPAKYKNAGLNDKWKVAQADDKNPRGPWWEIFHDPDLDRLETMAANGNQDLRLSIARLAESRAQARVAAADFYPHADFNGSYARQRTSNNEPIQRGRALNLDSLLGGGAIGGGTMGGMNGANTPAPVLDTQPLTRSFSVFRTPVDLNWEIDLFGRVRRGYEAARAERQAAEADAVNVNLSVTANVATMYFNLRAADAEVGVVESTIKARREALTIAQERLQAGLTGELDVQRERAELAGNEADLAAAQRARAEMENALATLVGQPASSFHLRRHELHTTPPRVPSGLPSELLERRPDVAGAERELAAANARIGVAVAAFFPRITLTGAAGFESATVLDVISPGSKIWQIGPSVSIPIFEGGRNSANLEATRARYDQQVARYRQQVLVAFQDVENALIDLRLLSVQSEAQSRAVEASQRTLDLANQSYRQGASTYLDITDAERTLFNNQRVAAQLLGQRMQATVQLIKALGGGWHR